MSKKDQITIQYRFALNDSKKLVDVLCLTSRDRNGNVFTCVGCGCVLIPKLGKIKNKHFAHKSISNTCSNESYLHKLHKLYFYEKYSECLRDKKSFTIETSRPAICVACDVYGINCEIEKKFITDLTRHYNNITIEEAWNGRIADILLKSTDKKEVLFIEFAVTHKCEESKILSGAKIIEYDVRHGGDTLRNISTCKIDNLYSRVVYYNFNKEKLVLKIDAKECKKFFEVFIIYGSMKSVLVPISRAKVEQHIKNHKIIYHEVCGVKGSLELDAYKNKVREVFYEKDIWFMNCFVCKYHASGFYHTVFCKIYKYECNPNDAVECSAFKAAGSMKKCLELDEKDKIWHHRQYLLSMRYRRRR